MIISLINEKIIDENNFEKYDRQNGYIYYLNGILFVKGKKVGEDSLFVLADEYEKTGKIPFSELYGAFSCVIVNPKGNIIAFSDNSNMHCFYLNNKYISSSFLSLVRCLSEKEDKKLEFNEEAVTEFYTLGNVYFEKTLIKNIQVSKSHHYYEIKNGIIKVNEKEIGDIESQSTITDPYTFLQEVGYAFSKEKFCLALTGGYDSRMLFSVLSKEVNVIPAISGNNEFAKDVLIANSLANIAHKQLKVIKVEKPHVDEKLLKSQFELSDGMNHFINDSRFRWSFFRNSLVNQGFNYHLTGDGGVLHKDWEWMQDLPFYKIKYTSLKRYYRQRIGGQFRANNIGQRLQKHAENQEDRFIKSLYKYKKKLNTQSYDALYNYVYGNRVFSYNISSHGLSSYAPLQELDLVKYSYHLPRKKRFFCNTIRDLTTQANPLMADLKTTHGTTASTKKTLILRDVFFQLYNYLEKGLRLVGRKLFKKTFFIENIINWSTRNEINKLKVTKEALNFCRDISFIEPSTSIKDLTDRQVGAMLHLYYLSKEM